VELAKEALRHGRAGQAAAFLRQARSAPAQDPETLRTLADVALVLRDRSAAAELLDRAIEARGAERAPSAWYRLLGETRANEGKLNQAVRAFRAALAKAPDDADTWRWLSRVLRTVDDLPAAVIACRRAVELTPEEWQARGELATLLLEARAFEEAGALFDQAAARAGDVPALIVGRAKLDAHCGRRSEAIASLRSCVARHPNHVPALAALALALRDERRFDDSLAAFRGAIALVPEDATLWCGLGRTLLEAGRAEESLSVAASYLEHRPGHAGALALDALARVALGDEDGAERLLDYDRLVARQRLPLPEGFADLSSFNSALAATLSTHPTLHPAPLRHATAAGLHSGSLLIDPPRVILALQRALQAAVAEYRGALPEWPEHPFVSGRTATAMLDMWCVVMERGGHQTPHIHPMAWLSGVYYPLLPAGMRSGEGPEGWLAFGEPDRDFPRRVQPRIVNVRPEEGLLLLFPSYFFHRTIPFAGVGTRISVAFDLIPVSPTR
jgi:uncharacterized protein (TIGR02466 family)